MIVPHFIIAVGDTHHGPLVPGMLIAIPQDCVSHHGLTGVSFMNPVTGGWSVGQKIGVVDLDIFEPGEKR